MVRLSPTVSIKQGISVLIMYSLPQRYKVLWPNFKKNDTSSNIWEITKYNQIIGNAIVI